MADDDFRERVRTILEEVEAEPWVYDTINSSAKFDVLVEICKRLLAEGQPQVDETTAQAERDFIQACGVHGKTIKGTMLMGDRFGLDFTDRTHIIVRIRDGSLGPSLTVEHHVVPL